MEIYDKHKHRQMCQMGSIPVVGILCCIYEITLKKGSRNCDFWLRQAVLCLHTASHLLVLNRSLPPSVSYFIVLTQAEDRSSRLKTSRSLQTMTFPSCIFNITLSEIWKTNIKVKFRRPVWSLLQKKTHSVWHSKRLFEILLNLVAAIWVGNKYLILSQLFIYR